MATHSTKYAWNTKTKELVDAEIVALSGRNHETLGTFVCTHDAQHTMKHVFTPQDAYNINGYFAHTKSCGEIGGGGCGGGGESELHARCKYLLKAFIGRYRFLLKSCKCHDSQTQKWECGEGSDGVTIEQMFRVESSRRRVFFDACLMRNGKPAVALEVCHTHRTGLNKIDSTRAEGVALAEFNTANILALEQLIISDDKHGIGTVFDLKNTIVEYFTCDTCVTRKAQEIERAIIERERVKRAIIERRRVQNALLKRKQDEEEKIVRRNEKIARRDEDMKKKIQKVTQETRAILEEDEKYSVRHKVYLPEYRELENKRHNIVSFVDLPLDPNPPSTPGLFFHAK